MIDVNLIGAPAFSVKVEGDGFIYTGVNRRLTALTGMRPSTMLGRSPQQCMQPDVADGVVARYKRCVEGRQAIDSEVHYTQGGDSRWWHVTLMPLLDETGAVSSLLGLSAEVTDRKAIEREKRESEARMALAMDVLDGGFWHLDVATGSLEVSNKLIALLTGDGTEKMSWDQFVDCVDPEDRSTFDASRMTRGDFEHTTIEYRVRTSADGIRWLRCKRRLIRNEADKPDRIIGVVVDITEQKRIQDFYEHQARTDPLTGLQNRRGFEANAAQFMHSPALSPIGFGLILLDLDRFKPINDMFGHAVGDIVLRELAMRLRQQIRPGDIVARLGGDEFAILVQDISDGELTRLADRLISAMGPPITTPVGDVSTSVSVGATLSLASDRDIQDLVVRADRALYEVKEAGRGSWKVAA